MFSRKLSLNWRWMLCSLYCPGLKQNSDHFSTPCFKNFAPYFCTVCLCFDVDTRLRAFLVFFVPFIVLLGARWKQLHMKHWQFSLSKLTSCPFPDWIVYVYVGSPLFFFLFSFHFSAFLGTWNSKVKGLGQRCHLSQWHDIFRRKQQNIVCYS